MSKRGSAIIWISIIIILLVVGAYFVYQSYFSKTKIESVNFVDLDYEEAIESNKCDKCLKGYYFENDEKICPQVTIEGVDIQDCQPHEVLCVGPNIKASFNLKVKKYKTPVYCKIISDKPERGHLMEKGINHLTNAFVANEGLNEIEDRFGNWVDREYRIRICCSNNENFDSEIIPYNSLDSREDIVCGHDTILDKRC